MQPQRPIPLIGFYIMTLFSWPLWATEPATSLQDLMNSATSDTLWPCQAEQLQQALQQLETRDPNNEAQQSLFERGDYRFVGVKADQLQIPGLSASDSDCVVSQGDYRLVKDVTTLPRCQEYDSLVEAAIAFADQYNTVVLQARQGEGLGVCKTNSN